MEFSNRDLLHLKQIFISMLFEFNLMIDNFFYLNFFSFDILYLYIINLSLSYLFLLFQSHIRINNILSLLFAVHLSVYDTYFIY